MAFCLWYSTSIHGHKERVFQETWNNREDLWGRRTSVRRVSGAIFLWSRNLRSSVWIITDVFRAQILNLLLFVLPTWNEYVRRKVDIEWQDDEKKIKIYIYNDCILKETPPLCYMEVTMTGQILNLQSQISAKMSGMKWSCSYCNGHDNKGD